MRTETDRASVSQLPSWGHLEREVAKERATRRRIRPVYRYWLRHGRPRPPEEHWCEFCVGWFGVPHDHIDGTIACRNLHKAFAGKRDCACIVCVVGERLGDQRRRFEAELDRRRKARVAEEKAQAERERQDDIAWLRSISDG